MRAPSADAVSRYSCLSAVWAADVSKARVSMGVESAGIPHSGHVAIPLDFLPRWQAPEAEEQVCNSLGQSRLVRIYCVLQKHLGTGDEAADHTIRKSNRGGLGGPLYTRNVWMRPSHVTPVYCSPAIGVGIEYSCDVQVHDELGRLVRAQCASCTADRKWKHKHSPAPAMPWPPRSLENVENVENVGRA